MKSKLAWVWFVVSVALLVLLLWQRREFQGEKLKLEQLQLQVENMTNQAKGQAKQWQQERQNLRGQLHAAENDLNSAHLAYASLANQMTNLTSASASTALNAPGKAAAGGPQGRAGAFPQMLGQMLKDPEMRKAMEQQQRYAMDMLYDPLMKKLQLTPDQEKQFKDILLDQQMANMSHAGSMFEQGMTNRAEISQQLAADQQKREQQIKDLLGDEKFARYQDYNQTAGERMMLQQFAKQVELTPDQTEQVLQIMGEEKKNAQINLGSAAYDPKKDWQKVLQNDGTADKLFQQQEQINQRVLDRASQVLSAEQLAKFAPALQNQLALQKAGLKMARQMFGGGQAPTSAPTAPAPAP